MNELQQTRESLRKLIDAANGAELTYTRAPKREEDDARDKWRSAEKALWDALDALLAERDEARESLAKAEARLKWIDDNAKYELVFTVDGDDLQIKRWVRKYVTYETIYGRGASEAIGTFVLADEARAATSESTNG